MDTYEKKYKEALEWLREGLYPATRGEIKEEMERYFPELKESEDERIRKEIIAFLKYYHTGQGNSAKYDDSWIAWLEKQGEQKPIDKIEPKFKVGDTVTVKPMSCHGKVFKGEPFKIVGIIKDNYVSDDGKTYSISLQDGWELVEQRPAWSEEDAKICGKCIDAASGYYSPEDKQIMKDWLRNLKERVQPQPKQEWTEEDETYLDHIITAVKLYYTDYKGEENPWRNELLRWLKSLRPQKQ